MVHSLKERQRLQNGLCGNVRKRTGAETAVAEGSALGHSPVAPGARLHGLVLGRGRSGARLPVDGPPPLLLPGGSPGHPRAAPAVRRSCRSLMRQSLPWPPDTGVPGPGPRMAHTSDDLLYRDPCTSRRLHIIREGCGSGTPGCAISRNPGKFNNEEDSPSTQSF